jgi:hypothetical protein
LKWLVAQWLRVGHQWLDAVTRAGQPIVNVHVKTIKFRGQRGNERRDRVQASFVDLLCQTVAQGAFVPTTDHEEDCKFCDYRTICGDTQRVTSWSQAMLKNSSNTALEPFRKLRGIDTAVP